jgi:hypothetical protein
MATFNNFNPTPSLYHDPPALPPGRNDDADNQIQRSVVTAPPRFVEDTTVQSYSLQELKQLGLGRTPSGYCYSGRMLLHAPLASVNEKEDPHPEQPARIEGIYNRFFCQFVFIRFVPHGNGSIPRQPSLTM